MPNHIYKINSVPVWQFLSDSIFKFPIESVSKTRNYLLLISKPTINCLYYASVNIAQPETASVQFSHSVVSDSLWPHESQHARPPCPSPTPGVHSDSRPLSRWCHTAISSTVIPFSSCPSPSQHQSLFQWVNSSHEVAKVLVFQLQHQSFQKTPRADL